MTKIVRAASLSLALAVAASLMGPPPFAAGQVKKNKKAVKPAPAAGSAVFELYTTKSGAFRFRLRNGKGKIMATASRNFKTKDDCQKVIDFIRTNAATAKMKDISGKK